MQHSRIRQRLVVPQCDCNLIFEDAYCIFLELHSTHGVSRRDTTYLHDRLLMYLDDRNDNQNLNQIPQRQDGQSGFTETHNLYYFSMTIVFL